MHGRSRVHPRPSRCDFLGEQALQAIALLPYRAMQYHDSTRSACDLAKIKKQAIIRQNTCHALVRTYSEANTRTVRLGCRALSLPLLGYRCTEGQRRRTWESCAGRAPVEGRDNGATPDLPNLTIRRDEASAHHEVLRSTGQHTYTALSSCT